MSAKEDKESEEPDYVEDEEAARRKATTGDKRNKSNNESGLLTLIIGCLSLNDCVLSWRFGFDSRNKTVLCRSCCR